MIDGGQVDADAVLGPGRSPHALCSLVLTDAGAARARPHAPAHASPAERSPCWAPKARARWPAPTRSPSVDAEALARVMAPYRVSTQTGRRGRRRRPARGQRRAAWRCSGSVIPGELDVRRAWRPRANSERLKVPLGPGGDGRPVYLDVKESAQGGMGPHGLVIGATGSGKSELLRTMVLGFAATHSSETLNLVLVDFKGGATFAGLAELPHTAAVITNLQDDLTLVDRMRDAIAGELNRRQEALRDAGNFASVRDYEKARASGADAGAAAEPLDHLRRVQRAARRRSRTSSTCSSRSAGSAGRSRSTCASRRSGSRRASSAAWTAICPTGSASRRSPRRRAARSSGCRTRSSCRRSPARVS